MNNDLKIRADLLRDGIELPDSWRDDKGALIDSREEIDELHLYYLDGLDFQSILGVARKLDEWEKSKDHSHVASLARVFHQGVRLRIEVEIMAILDKARQIGRDHQIRRFFGEEPSPGTLANLHLMEPHHQWWRYDARHHRGVLIEWDRNGEFVGSAGCGKKAPLQIPEFKNRKVPLDPILSVHRAIFSSEPEAP